MEERNSDHLQEHLRVLSVLNKGHDQDRGQNRHDHPGQLLLGYEVVEQGQPPVVYLCSRLVKAQVFICGSYVTDK